MNLADHRVQDRAIQFGLIIFWAIFWFLNIVDKFIQKPTFLWLGKDRLTQFGNYFKSIGIAHPMVPLVFLVFTAALQVLAFLLLFGALILLIKSDEEGARMFFFWGTFVGIFIFSFFAIGDQIFGDRFELLEHTTYWIALIISWGAYIYFPKQQ
jgi:hypothetical protein